MESMLKSTSSKPNGQSTCKSAGKTNVAIVAWFVRQHYDSTKNKDSIDVPVDVKQIISNYSKKVFDSKILSKFQDMDLINLLPRIKKAKLLYRASENEYSASEFHRLCDGKGATVTIIKNNFGNIFGGYTNIPWSSDNKHHSDQGESSIYLLYSHNNKIPCPKIWLPDHYMAEVSHPSNGGPAFGNRSDINIKDKCNIVIDKVYSYCWMGTYLTHKEINKFTGGSLTYNKGAFLVSEYEVFLTSE